jgi:hypothetical protein
MKKCLIPNCDKFDSNENNNCSVYKRPEDCEKYTKGANYYKIMGHKLEITQKYKKEDSVNGESENRVVLNCTCCSVPHNIIIDCTELNLTKFEEVPKTEEQPSS